MPSLRKGKARLKKMSQTGFWFSTAIWDTGSPLSLFIGLCWDVYAVIPPSFPMRQLASLGPLAPFTEIEYTKWAISNWRISLGAAAVREGLLPPVS
jgi:hypothetical protein